MADFTTVFFDDFNGNALNTSTWRALYSGQYWNNQFSWTPSKLEVGDGKLTIATERAGDTWLSGGLSTIPDGQTYGSYEFRARVDEGQGTAAVVLLWPSNNQWTDEVDILETHRGDRKGFSFTNHGDPNVTQGINVDAAQWHTYRLDWTPGDLKLFVDGQQHGHITTDVPSQPMSFGMQGQVMAPWETWFGGAPDGTTPNRVELEVDWVRVSAWTPGQGDSAPPQSQSAPQAAPQAAAFTADAPGGDWIAIAQTYLSRDGEWEGSWRNQVAAGQITVEDVASRLAAGQGNPDLLW